MAILSLPWTFIRFLFYKCLCVTQLDDFQKVAVNIGGSTKAKSNHFWPQIGESKFWTNVSEASSPMYALANGHSKFWSYQLRHLWILCSIRLKQVLHARKFPWHVSLVSMRKQLSWFVLFILIHSNIMIEHKYLSLLAHPLQFTALVLWDDWLWPHSMWSDDSRKPVNEGSFC